MSQRTVCVVSLLCFVASSAWGQTLATKDSAGTLIAGAAFGALTGGTPVTDVVLEGRAAQPDGEAIDTGLARLAAISPRHSRQELQMGNGPFTLVRRAHSENSGGAWLGPDGEQNVIPIHNSWTPADWFFPIFTLAAAASDPEISVRYVGRETREGNLVERLRLSRVVPGQQESVTALIEKLSTVDVYLDPATLLPVALAYQVHPDDDAGMDIPTEVRFGKYQSVGGLHVPTVVQQLLQGQVILELAIDSAAANTGLTEFDFAL